MNDQQGSKNTAVRVVVAEDEAIVRLDLKEILASAGYEVVGKTGRGDDAVRLAAETKPDLADLGREDARDERHPGRKRDHQGREGGGDGPHRVQPTGADRRGPRRRGGGVLVKPFRRDELLSGRARARLVSPGVGHRRARFESFNTDGASAEDKIATRRLVEEAKAKLIEKSSLTESDAFSFIQRTAMRTRSRIREVARQVIDGSLSP